MKNPFKRISKEKLQIEISELKYQIMLCEDSIKRCKRRIADLEKLTGQKKGGA